MTLALLLALAAPPADLRDRLAAALAKTDLPAVRAAVAEVNRHLGEAAGIPEVPDQFIPTPADGRWLTPAEAAGGFDRLAGRLDQLKWWATGLDPTKLGHPLREPAAVASGVAAAERAKLRGVDRKSATDAADFLVWAQERAGTGVIPFPASRGVSTAAPFRAAEKYLDRVEREGRLDQVVRNGWAVDDAGDGGLQFDTGEGGVALFDVAALTGDNKYLAAARRAADWAAARPCVPNWNYNSFSVFLLARAFRATGERTYLDASTRKAVVGVIPGQLTDGKHAGRWGDPHNARPAYHYIMLRALAELLAVLPADAPERPAVRGALEIGLTARNADLFGPGVATKDKTVDALLAVHRLGDDALTRDTRSGEALDRLGKLVSKQYRRGGAPLGPREWGLFLEHAVGR